jgi:DNA-binding MarR family transcriptional regulator
VEEQGRPVVQLAREFALAQIIASHRTREKIFGRRLTNAAWDMFVEIAFEEMQGRLITVSSALNSSGVPISTAKRHLHILEDLQLIERSPDETDRRSVLLSTSAKGRKLLDGFAEAYVGRCNSARSTISCELPQNENRPGVSSAPCGLPNRQLDRGRNRPSGRL